MNAYADSNSPARRGQVIGRRPLPSADATAAGCDVRRLLGECASAMSAGVQVLEIELSCVGDVDADLLAALRRILQGARTHRVLLHLKPSVALDRWLTACGLDHHLQPLGRAAA